jgi:hypothetical protein
MLRGNVYHCINLLCSNEFVRSWPQAMPNLSWEICQRIEALNHST